MNKFLIYVVNFIFLTAFPIITSGKNYPLRHFTTENGLPSNTIYGLYRDSKGFLWICTDKGVVRYNGIEFERFTTDDGLPDNEIFFFQEDYDGRLWLGTYNGELCYYKDDTFHTDVNTPFLKKCVKYSFISWIKKEKDSSVTILFNDQLAFLNIKQEKCNSFYINCDKFPNKDPILFIDKLSEDKYHILSSKYSFTIDTASNYVGNTLRKNNDNYKWCASQDDKYLYSYNGVYSSDQQLLLKFNAALATLYIYVFYKFNDGVFVGTSNGLFINNDVQILKGNKVSYITQDIEGNYWIGTLNNGLYCLNKDFSSTEEYDEAYAGNVIYASSLGKYLFYTTGNSNFYRFENNKIVLLFDYYKHFGKFFREENAWQRYLATNTFGQGVNNNYQYYNIEKKFSFAIDKINTNFPAVWLFESYNRNLTTNVKELLFGTESVFIRNSDFISTFAKLNNKHKKPINIKKIGDNPRGKRVFGIALSSNNVLWYSSSKKVNKIMDSITIPQEQFGNITFKWLQIVQNFAIGITHKNQLLVCHNFADNNISIDSIPGQNFVWDKLYKLNDSTFLVSTNNLYRLLSLHNANSNPCYNLQVIENNSLPILAEYICNNDSFCYFFKKGAITKVPISGLVVKYKTPEIFFKTLKTRSKSYPIRQSMVINYNESKNISISFSPFSFGSKYIICEYSISKDSTDYWRQVKNNEINLFDPPFGSYTVKIKAKTLSGDFSKPFVFNFTISKPFWATSWFIISCILLFLSLIILTIKLITLRNTRKKELIHQNEIKFMKSEYKALNALMNPHFIFNTLNNVQWLVNNDDKKTATHYLRVFSDLVRQNMHNISKELIPLKNEIELVNNYLKLEKLRFKEALNYEINIADDLDLDSVKIPPLLIQPLVENAIKHGLLPGATNKNLLKIDVYRKQDKLYIDISDNGIGFNESQKKAKSLHKSTSIGNVRDRIEKLSLMHNINISLKISEVRNDSSYPLGTLARIGIDINEELEKIIVVE